MNLGRFLDAQARLWPRPLEEIESGRKQTHWMWFVFPQLRGLGHSANARFYGIADLAEAEQYIGHEVLGPRLLAISTAMLAHDGAEAEAILGPVDAMKLRSCATLFAHASEEPVFPGLLNAFFSGTPCEKTLHLLSAR
ncbi:MAG: DUF1810 domain-containing protein [Roseovarius sp.]